MCYPSLQSCYLLKKTKKNELLLEFRVHRHKQNSQHYYLLYIFNQKGMKHSQNYEKGTHLQQIMGSKLRYLRFYFVSIQLVLTILRLSLNQWIFLSITTLGRSILKECESQYQRRKSPSIMLTNIENAEMLTTTKYAITAFVQKSGTDIRQESRQQNIPIHLNSKAYPLSIQNVCVFSVQQFMNQHNSQNISKKKASAIKYRKYDHKKRLRLIQMVSNEGKSLASSAKFLGIAQTTARLIMKTWKEEGRVFQKKVDKVKREKREAQKLSQTKRKDKERQKKEAKKQKRITRNIQRQETAVKLQENEGQENIQIGYQNLPQVPVHPNVFYPTYPVLQSYVYVVPQAGYFGMMGM